MNPVGKSLRLGLRLVKVAFTNPRRLSHVLGSALAASEDVADRSLDLLRLPLVTVEDLVPREGVEIATLALFAEGRASISPVESLALVLLLKRAQARNVFEFGTYKGISISQLALNVPDGGQIRTLDLPDDNPQYSLPITGSDDVFIALEKGKGALVPPQLRQRIQFLKGDSAKFDETPLLGLVDFVFVDGAHDSEYVRNDSEKGWRMLRPGGTIVWHDCRVQYPMVLRYVLECPYKPSRIAQTSLAFAIKPSGT
jgi:predicted O-methyltransferase YrrM